jgi:nucleoid-associated protein YgaU
MNKKSAFTQSIWVRAAIFFIASLTSLATLAQTPAKEPSLPYVVKPSDNLSKFGRDMLTSPRAWNEVAKFNQLKDPNVIFPGQKLDIPLRFLKSKPASVSSK